jgi:type IV pilus assembly protein PilB
MARLRIGDLLVQVGLIDEMQLQAALSQQRQWGGRLGDVLIDKGFVDEMMLYRGLAKQLRTELVAIPHLELSQDIVRSLPEDVCLKHGVLPIARDDREVTVAMSDPGNIEALDEIGFRSGVRVKTVLAPSREIEWAHRRFFHGEMGPCPPPKTKRERLPTGKIEIVRPERERDAPARAAPTPADGDPIERAELALAETTHLLRLLVDTCVKQGLFTREEYLERVRRKR